MIYAAKYIMRYALMILDDDDDGREKTLEFFWVGKKLNV